jgi:predicted nuclease of predicted toxin-antitoxin system
MKFLIDAQLPRRLAHRLRSEGHDALHTLDLPAGNRTPDATVAQVADRDRRVLVSKDADFVSSHLLKGEPRQLLLVSTGNLSNVQLEGLFVSNLPALVEAFEASAFVELGRSIVVVRHGH